MSDNWRSGGGGGGGGGGGRRNNNNNNGGGNRRNRGGRRNNRNNNGGRRRNYGRNRNNRRNDNYKLYNLALYANNDSGEPCVMLLQGRYTPSFTRFLSSAQEGRQFKYGEEFPRFSLAELEVVEGVENWAEFWDMYWQNRKPNMSRDASDFLGSKRMHRVVQNHILRIHKGLRPSCEPFWGLARSQRKHAASDADWNQCLSEMTSIGIAPDAMTQIPELTRQDKFNITFFAFTESTVALPSTDTDIDVQARVWMTAAEAEAALDGDHTIQQERAELVREGFELVAPYMSGEA